MGDTRRAIERGLEFSLVPEAAVGIGAGVEQGGRGLEEARGAGGVEAQVLRQTEVYQGFTAKGRRLGANGRRILGEEASHRRCVTEHRGGMDVTASELGMFGEERFGAGQVTVPDRVMEERAAGIGRASHDFSPRAARMRGSSRTLRASGKPRSSSLSHSESTIAPAATSRA